MLRILPIKCVSECIYYYTYYSILYIDYNILKRVVRRNTWNREKKKTKCLQRRYNFPAIWYIIVNGTDILYIQTDTKKDTNTNTPIHTHTYTFNVPLMLMFYRWLVIMLCGMAQKPPLLCCSHN